MRALPIRSILLLSLLIASSASAVTMDWTLVGNPGNACDPQSDGCYGAVGYAYQIGAYEVTNAQYAEFLNAKAKSDPLGLYDRQMGVGTYSGIQRSGTPGNYTYTASYFALDQPVGGVSFYNALRFANWMNNGQANADTETGAYTLLGGTSTPSNGDTVTRNPGATIVLTSEDEWYKAAYYDRASSSYFDYPAGSNTQTVCSSSFSTPNRANCNQTLGFLTSVGGYVNSASPYGTFDQGGNVWEWNEEIIDHFGIPFRGIRGGSLFTRPDTLAALARASYPPSRVVSDSSPFGFRIAMIPEPGTGPLVIAGLLGLAGRRRGRA